MDSLTFIAEMIKALAWPAVLLVVALLLRRPLRELLPLLTKFKYRELELEFDKQVTELTESAAAELPAPIDDKIHYTMQERLLRLATISPQAAIIEAWRYLETRLLETAKARNVEVAPAVWKMPLVLGALMHAEDTLSESQLSILTRVKLLRDKAVHELKMQLTADEAIKFCDLAIHLAATLH